MDESSKSTNLGEALMNNYQLKRSIKYAARSLDKVMPGWRDYINWARIDMVRGYYRPWEKTSCGCLLSQLDSQFNNGDLGIYHSIEWLNSRSMHSMAFKPTYTISNDPEALEDWSRACKKYWLLEKNRSQETASTRITPRTRPRAMSGG